MPIQYALFENNLTADPADRQAGRRRPARNEYGVPGIPGANVPWRRESSKLMVL